MLKSLALGLLAAQSAASMRFAMYIDEWVLPIPTPKSTSNI